MTIHNRQTSDNPTSAGDVLKEFEALNRDVRAALKKHADETGEIKSQIIEMEGNFAQRAAFLHTGGGSAVKSWGQQFVNDQGLREFSEYRARPSRFSLEVKSTMTSDAASAGALGAPSMVDNGVLKPRRRLTIRDLCNELPTTSGSVEYAKQTTRTIAAAPVAEGAAKPESALAFTLVNVPIRTIAHWIPAARQILEDAPQLLAIIDGELRYGLGLVEETQLLSGDGSGQNLYGMIPQATAFSAPFSVAMPTMIDTIGLALVQAAETLIPPDGIVMSQTDWWKMRLLKNSDGEYLLGDPSADVAPRLFGLPVVPTPAMADNNFMVGAFKASATIYDRWQSRVEVSTEHADFFTRNLVAVLCEERIGLAVKRPDALIYGHFTA